MQISQAGQVSYSESPSSRQS